MPISIRNRFFTARGESVGWRNAPNIFRSFRGAIARKRLGQYPELPWIPFSAIKALDTLIQADWRVWEIGSGMSTLWLARRAGHVTSVEASREWHARLSQIVMDRGVKNIDLRYRWVASEMADFSNVPDQSLDLLYVDGGPRDTCLANGISKVKPGGYAYLDNWDIDEFWSGSRDLLNRLDLLGPRARRFVDYVPGTVGPTEGLLVQVTGRQSEVSEQA